MNKVIKFCLIMKNPQYRRAFLRHRVAAAVEHENLFSRIGSELETVVDIGANRGQFALIASVHAPKAQIHSFEPLEEANEVFRLVFQEQPNVVLHKHAIGSALAEALLHVSRADDSSSLLPISDLQVSIFPGTEERSVRAVEVKPLAETLNKAMLHPPALLKIDVQGYELEVLKGCADLLTSFNYLLIEGSYVELYEGQALVDEIIQYLDLAGFEFVERQNLMRNKQHEPIQADFFFRSI